ncbi:MAG: insulinase family protein [Nitratireductor sp.]|jgi:zinc protease|nr:insulinase family protein [Nitratireductor sp.]
MRRIAFLIATIALLAVAPGREAFSLTKDGPEIVTGTLDNGLEVVVIPDRRAPVVTHMIWYKVGSADEERGKSGLAHFLEHLMFKGTRTYPEREFSRKVAEIGGEENAFTSSDYTAYYQKVSPEALAMVMGYESDRMQNLVLTDENVLPERDVILQERGDRVESSPGAILDEAMSAALYSNHPYGIPVIGWRHEIAKLTRQDAIEFYDRFYTPNNAILVVAGDVDPQAVMALARSTYGKAPRRAEPGERIRPAEPEPVTPRRITYADPRVSTPSVQRTYMVPSYRQAEPREAEALDILAAIIGGASDSRFRTALVIDNPVATHAGAYYGGGAYDYGEFTIYARPLAGNSLEAIEAKMDAIIERVLKEGVTQEELETAREVLVRTTIFERDSQTRMAQIYGSVLTSGGTIADITQWPDRVRMVTLEDVNLAARKWLDIRRSVTGLLLPKEGS